MKTLKTLFVLLAILLAVSAPSFAQSTPAVTQITSAVAGGATVTTFVVSATTGITASTNSAQQFCIVNHEVVLVRSISSLNLTVQRAYAGSAIGHAANEVLICGQNGTFNPTTGNTSGVFISSAAPSGSCTAANNQFLPVVYIGSGSAANWGLYNCNNSRWVAQTFPDDVPPTITRYCMPQFLGALTLFRTSGAAPDPFDVGTNTTPVAARWQYGTIEVPKSQLFTGVSFLNGAVAGTDLVIGAVWRADGTRLANTATAGITASGVHIFQDLNFTGQVFLTGPARYWIGWQANGTTTRISTVSLTPGATTAGLGAFIGMLGSFATGTSLTVPSNLASFAANITTGTVTSLPTSLISASAPIACLF